MFLNKVLYKANKKQMHNATKADKVDENIKRRERVKLKERY